MKSMLKDERIGKATFTGATPSRSPGRRGDGGVPVERNPEARAASPSLKGPQAGGYYRFAIGRSSDRDQRRGLELPADPATWAPEASKEELEGMLRSPSSRQTGSPWV